jgi:hypothetical protein
MLLKNRILKHGMHGIFAGSAKTGRGAESDEKMIPKMSYLTLSW